MSNGNGKIVVPLPTRLEIEATKAKEIMEIEHTLHECAKEVHVLEWRAALIEQRRQAS